MKISNIMSIGTEGSFSFLVPFNATMSTYVIYRILSISKLSSIKEQGLDPLNNIYIIGGLTEVDYINDLNNDVTIVQLGLGSGAYYIPEGYISAGPSQDGVNYAKQSMGINLGTLPKDIDLTNLKLDIVELVKSHLGINCSIKNSDISNMSKIPYNIHNQFLTIRNSRITAGDNYKDKYDEKLVLINKLYDKISDLEEVFLKYKIDGIV